MKSFSFVAHKTIRSFSNKMRFENCQEFISALDREGVDQKEFWENVRNGGEYSEDIELRSLSSLWRSKFRN